MSWLLSASFLGFVLIVASLDPRRIPRRSALGQAMQRAGRSARREIESALREGRAVGDPALASLTAAVAQERMNRIDYRGPLLRQEKLMLLAGIAEVGLVFAVGAHHLATQYSDAGGSVLVVFWVVVLRRATPSHRHSTDRLLTAYRANLSLAGTSEPGELDRRVLLGMP